MKFERENRVKLSSGNIGVIYGSFVVVVWIIPYIQVLAITHQCKLEVKVRQTRVCKDIGTKKTLGFTARTSSG